MATRSADRSGEHLAHPVAVAGCHDSAHSGTAATKARDEGQGLVDMLLSDRRRRRGLAAILAGVLLAGLLLAAAPAPAPQAVWRVDPLGSPVPDPVWIQLVGAVAVQDSPGAIQRPYAFNVIEGDLWVTWWDGGNWVWTGLGGAPSGSAITGTVGAITVATGPGEAKQPYAFVTTADGHLWANRWTGDG